jgi:hypothetical protein
MPWFDYKEIISKKYCFIRRIFYFHTFRMNKERGLKDKDFHVDKRETNGKTDLPILSHNIQRTSSRILLSTNLDC